MALLRLLVSVLALAALLAPSGAAAHAGHEHPVAQAGAVPEPAHKDTIQEINFDFAGVVQDAEASMATTAASPLPLTWCGT